MSEQGRDFRQSGLFWKFPVKLFHHKEVMIQYMHNEKC